MRQTCACHNTGCMHVPSLAWQWRPGSAFVLRRDHAAWCPYCERVWLQLEEKRIPYSIEKINMRCYGAPADSSSCTFPHPFPIPSKHLHA
jgi:hypothetical protein